MNNFHKILKETRLSYKSKDNTWTQGYVADKVKVARTTYTAYENGTKQPTLETLIALADLFDVSTDYLLGRKCKVDNSKNEMIVEKLEEVINFIKVN